MNGAKLSTATLRPSTQNADRQPEASTIAPAITGQNAKPSRLPLITTAVANARRWMNQLAITVCDARFWMFIIATRPTENAAYRKIRLDAKLTDISDAEINSAPTPRITRPP
jgi:hypothetical protein